MYKNNIHLHIHNTYCIQYTLDAVDYNASQNAILELKIAAIKSLITHAEFLELLGEVPSTKRYYQSNALINVKPYHPSWRFITQ